MAARTSRITRLHTSTFNVDLEKQMGIGRTSRRASVRLGTILAGILISLAVPSAASAATAAFTSRAPGSGATLTNARPTLSVRVYDRYGISGTANSSMSLDGRGVAVTRRYADSRHLTLSSRPATLGVGAHRVSVRVRDKKGRVSTTSWTFTVKAQTPAPIDMPASIVASDCASCHVEYPAQHPMTACQSCHGPERPVPGVAFTPASTSAHTASCAALPCHRQSDTFPHVLGSDCTSCHGRYNGIPAAHGAPTAATHRSTNVFCTKAGCHDASLTVEHYRHSIDGVRLSCATCHSSTDGAVRAALASGSTDCLSCHPDATTTHPGLSAAHVSADAGCSATGCHSTDLPTVHGGNCAPCHGAGATPSAKCTTCHADASHAALHVITRNDTCTGAQCHDGASLTAIQVGAAPAKAHQTCTTCHASSDAAVKAAIAGGDKRCAACHGDFVDHAAQHVVDRSADTCAGQGCHPATLTSLTTIHPTCDTCHASGDATVTAAIARGDKSCAACHAFSGHAPVHTSTMADSCVATGCHDATSVDLTVQHPTCETCHASTDPTVHAAVAAHDTRCIACHPDAGHFAVHAVYIPEDCDSELCHRGPNGNLTREHLGCDTCHRSTDPRVIAAIANKTNDCTSCH